MSNMKVVIWVVTEEKDGQVDVDVFTTFDEAKAHCDEIVSDLWRVYKPTEAQPNDWAIALEELRDSGDVISYLDITHHDLDAVAVMRTLQKPVGAAA